MEAKIRITVPRIRCRKLTIFLCVSTLAGFFVADLVAAPAWLFLAIGATGLASVATLTLLADRCGCDD